MDRLGPSPLQLPANYQALPAIMTYHHHHLYEFLLHPPTNERDLQPQPHELKLSSWDHNGYYHEHFHVFKQEPTSLTLNYTSEHGPPQIEVSSSVLICQTALFIEEDHLHFRHQLVHFHKIYCGQMWPVQSAQDPSDPRIFFPELHTRTMTKSGVFVNAVASQGGGPLMFQHYHTHWHTLIATAAKHPESMNNPQP